MKRGRFYIINSSITKKFWYAANLIINKIEEYYNHQKYASLQTEKKIFDELVELRFSSMESYDDYLISNIRTDNSIRIDNLEKLNGIFGEACHTFEYDIIIVLKLSESTKQFYQFIPFFHILNKHVRNQTFQTDKVGNEIVEGKFSLAIDLNDVCAQKKEELIFTLSQFFSSWRNLTRKVGNAKIPVVFRIDKESKIPISQKFIPASRFPRRGISNSKFKKYSRRFSPLLSINEETLDVLFYKPVQRMINFSTEKIYQPCSEGSAYKQNHIVRLFVDTYNNIGKKKDARKKKELINFIIPISDKEFCNSSLVSYYLFLILLYELLESKNNWRYLKDKNRVKNLIELVIDYTDGIEEIAENIITHCKQEGYFYFACNQSALYSKDKYPFLKNFIDYQKKNSNLELFSNSNISFNRYFEVVVYDFCELV